MSKGSERLPELSLIDGQGYDPTSPASRDMAGKTDLALSPFKITALSAQKLKL